MSKKETKRNRKQEGRKGWIDVEIGTSETSGTLKQVAKQNNGIEIVIESSFALSNIVT